MMARADTVIVCSLPLAKNALHSRAYLRGRLPSRLASALFAVNCVVELPGGNSVLLCVAASGWCHTVSSRIVLALSELS